MSVALDFNTLTEQGEFTADTVQFINKTSADVVTPSSGTKLYSIGGLFSWVNSDGFTRTLDGTLTASRVYTLPDVTDTLTTLTATQTLTNKTLTSNTNNVTAKGLFSATTTVDVSAATAPTSGQVLTATSSTAATWQTLTAISILNYNATESTQVNMTNTAFTIIGAMTLTPAVTGTYLVIFDSSFFGNDTNLVRVAIYNNGVQVADSVRQLGDTQYNAVMTSTVINWTAGAVEARAAVTSGSTVPFYNRALHLLRIG